MRSYRLAPIVPIAARKCMSTVPATASVFLNLPALITAKRGWRTLPQQHRINESAVLTLVSDMLRAIAEYSKNNRAEFVRTVQETQAAQQASDISKKKKRLATAPLTRSMHRSKMNLPVRLQN